MNEFKKRKLGLVYDAFDKDILAMQQYTRRLVDEYNSLSPINDTVVICEPISTNK